MERFTIYYFLYYYSTPSQLPEFMKNALTPCCHIKLCGVNDTAKLDSAVSMTTRSLTHCFHVMISSKVNHVRK